MASVPIGCKGFAIKNGPIDDRRDGLELQAGWDFQPHSLDPYTVPCEHNSCDFTVTAKWQLIKALASGILGEANAPTFLFIIQHQGWAQKVRNKTLEERNGMLLNVSEWPVAHSDTLWSPLSLTNLEQETPGRSLQSNPGRLPMSTWTKALWNGDIYFHMKMTQEVTDNYINFSLINEIMVVFEKVGSFIL